MSSTRDDKRTRIFPGMMVTFTTKGYDARLFMLGLMVMSTVASCGVCKPKPVIEYRDSVRVEYRDRIVHDTATFEIPVIVEKNVTRDTSSHLENPYAKSDAVVSDGFLWHSLESIPQTIEVPVEVPVTDTLIIEKEAQVIEKEVETKLSWWQGFRIDAFWWLVLALVLTNIKSILKFLKVII